MYMCLQVFRHFQKNLHVCRFLLGHMHALYCYITVTLPIIANISAPISPPSNVRLSDAQDGMLIFNWDSRGPNCESVNYGIISSCGNCPNTTNSTQITCSDLNLSTSVRLCSFMVRTVLCDDGTTTLSDPVVVTLKRKIDINLHFTS